MPYYCVNKNAQSNGDHEVHDTTANRWCLPDASNRRDLGYHAGCAGAVTAARAAFHSGQRLCALRASLQYGIDLSSAGSPSGRELLAVGDQVLVPLGDHSSVTQRDALSGSHEKPLRVVRREALGVVVEVGDDIGLLRPVGPGAESRIRVAVA